MPKFVFLWTDLILWLLAAGSVFYVLKVRRDRNLLATWRRIARDAPAMCAAVLLVVFLGLAFADSIHFRPRLPPAVGPPADAPVAYATRTVSILDTVLVHAIDSREKTYSAPLAYASFQRETKLEDGKEIRFFPRLYSGGVHLADPAKEWAGDIARRSAVG